MTNEISRRNVVKGLAALALSPLFPGDALAKSTRPERRWSGHYAFVQGEDRPLLPLNDEVLDKKFYMASTLKIATLACVFDALEKGEIDWNDKIPVSRHAQVMSSHRADFPELTVRQAAEMSGSISINDATIALAEFIADKYKSPNDIVRGQAGLETLFVEKHIGGLLSDLDMQDTLIVNSTGLPIYSKADKRRGYTTMELPNSQSSFRDMHKLISHVLSYKDYLEVFSVPWTKVNTFRGRLHSGNMLLPGNERDDAQPYQGVMGLKSGYTYASGSHLIATYETGGQTLVSMTIGSDSDERIQDQVLAMDTTIAAYNQRNELNPNHALA